MISFKKVLNLKFLSFILCLLFLFEPQAYSYTLSKETLRVPSSFENRESPQNIQKALPSNAKSTVLKFSKRLSLAFAAVAISVSINAAIKQPVKHASGSEAIVTEVGNVKALVGIDSEAAVWLADLGYKDIPEDMQMEFVKLFKKIGRFEDDVRKAKEKYAATARSDVYVDTLKGIIGKIWEELIDAKYFKDDKNGKPNALMSFLITGIDPNNNIFKDIEDLEVPVDTVDKEALRKSLTFGAIQQLEYIAFKYVGLDPIPAFGRAPFNLIHIQGKTYLVAHINVGKAFKIDIESHYIQLYEKKKGNAHYYYLNNKYRTNPQAAGRLFYDYMAGLRKLNAGKDSTLYVGRNGDDMGDPWIVEKVNAIAPFLLVCDAGLKINDERNYVVGKSIKDFGLTFAVRLLRASVYSKLDEVEKNITFKRALYEIEESKRLNPYCSRAWNYLGGIYRELGDFQNAVRKYQWAMGLNPSDPETYANLGVLYIATKDWQEAISKLEQGIKLGYMEPLAYLKLGQAYYYLAKTLDKIGAPIDKAIEAFTSAKDASTKAIELDPKARDWQPYFIRGASYFSLFLRAIDAGTMAKYRTNAITDFAKAVNINKGLLGDVPPELQIEVDQQSKKLAPVSESALLGWTGKGAGLTTAYAVVDIHNIFSTNVGSGLTVMPVGPDEQKIEGLLKKFGCAPDKINDILSLPDFQRLIKEVEDLKNIVKKLKEEYNQRQDLKRYTNGLKNVVEKLWGILYQEGYLDINHIHPLVRLLVVNTIGLEEDIFNKIEKSTKISPERKQILIQNFLKCVSRTQLCHILYIYAGLDAREGFCHEHVCNFIWIEGNKYLYADIIVGISELNIPGHYRKDTELQAQGKSPYYFLSGDYRMPAETISKLMEKRQRGVEISPEEALNLDVPYVYLGNGGLGFISSIANIKANTYLELGEMDKALKAAIESTNSNPNDAENYVVLGAIYDMKDEWFKAKEAYNKAIALNNKVAAAHHNLGMIHFKLKDYKDAMEAFQMAYALEPSKPLFAEHRNFIVAEWKKFMAMKKQYEEVSNKNIGTEKMREIGIIYYMLSEYKKSLDILERVIKEAPHLPEPYLFRGWIYYRAGKKEEAVTSWAIAIQKANPEEVLRYVPNQIRIEVQTKAKGSYPVSSLLNTGSFMAVWL